MTNRLRLGLIHLICNYLALLVFVFAGENEAAIRVVFQDLRLFPCKGVGGMDRSMAKVGR